MNVIEPPDEPTLDDLLQVIEPDQLDKYILDPNTATELVSVIEEATGWRWARLPLYAIFRILASFILARTKGQLNWLGDTAKQHARRVVHLVPGYKQLADCIMQLKARLDSRIDAKNRLDLLLAGNIRYLDSTISTLLPEDIRLGLLQMDSIAELHADLERNMQQILEVLEPQPRLSLRHLSGRLENRFRFGARWGSFQGRDAEQARLNEFLACPRRFCWWLVTGAGGQGKSRLAMEFCLTAGVAWRSGFLDELAAFGSWSTWQPDLPTLIVVDYAASRTAVLRDMLAILGEREDTDPLRYPVRALLLERDKSDAWWSNVRRRDHTGQLVMEAAFHQDPLALGPLSDDALWNIIQTILGDAQTSALAKQETLTHLHAMDPHRRPLFAAFLADAIAKHDPDYP